MKIPVNKKHIRHRAIMIGPWLLALGLGSVPLHANTFAYVTNNQSNTVSVIDTATNTVVGAPISVGSNPAGVAITPDSTRAYVANFSSNTVSVIDTTTNTVVGAPISV